MQIQQPSFRPPRPVFRLSIGQFLLWCLMISLSLRAPESGAADGITGTQVSPVHPVLVRNPHGPLLKILLKTSGADTPRVNLLKFSLNGTDNLSDIESLALFSTGENDEFSPDHPISEPAAPERELSFQTNLTLRPGRNVIWLSCRLNENAGLLRQVAATCLQIDTSKGDIKPDIQTSAVSHRIGYALRRHNDDGVHTSRIPALGTTARGTLLCVYDLRRQKGRDLQEDIDIGLSRSTDGGNTWEPVRVIMDMGEYGGLPQAQNGCSDPGIIIDRQTGHIFCFALWMNGKPGKHQWVEDGSEPGFEIGKTAQLMMVKSEDDGQTWSPPENLTRVLKKESWWLFAPSPQQGIQLTDGTLVMPMQGREQRDATATFATVMISRDHGATWNVARPGFRGGNECQAAVLSDGAIMLNVRNDQERFRGVVVTRDLGQSWEQHPTSRNTLIEPNCNGSLLSIDCTHEQTQKHVQLFANPHTQKGRTHHTIQVSFDDGLTWPKSHHLLLDEGKGAGYPSMTRVDDQHVGIVYEGSQSQLVFEKLSIQELLNERTLASTTSQVK
jgi:sialidase-1